MGAVTVTLDTWTTHADDHQRRITGSLSLSNSYATGGDTITPGQLGLGLVDDIFIAPAGGWVFVYKNATGKIQAYGQQPTSSTAGVIALSEAAATTDLSAVSARFFAYGV